MSRKLTVVFLASGKTVEARSPQRLGRMAVVRFPRRPGSNEVQQQIQVDSLLDRGVEEE